VPIRFAGRLPVIDLRRAEEGGEDAGMVVNVPYEWIAGRDHESLFVVDVPDDQLKEHGIPAGSWLLCQAVDSVGPANGQVILVRIDKEVHLHIVRRVLGIMEFGSLTENQTPRASDDTAEIIGVVLYSWTRRI
jgi:SOS-response transcriptional repressor LexA